MIRGTKVFVFTLLEVLVPKRDMIGMVMMMVVEYSMMVQVNVIRTCMSL